MAAHLVTGIYRNVDFSQRCSEYERAFREEVARFSRWAKEKKGTVRKKTERWSWHEKHIPGAYRKPRKLRNHYVEYHSD